MNRHVILAGSPSAATEEAKIRKLELDWEQAVQSKDLEKIVQFYAPDGSMMADRVPIANGTAAIRRVWQQVLGIPGFGVSFTPTRIDVAEAHDMASDIGTFTVSAVDASGKVNTIVGKYVAVWRKQPDGQWRVTADIFNFDS
jgi:uncharacterized protein (TIGR02246 family)